MLLWHMNMWQLHLVPHLSLHVSPDLMYRRDLCLWSRFANIKDPHSIQEQIIEKKRAAETPKR